MWYTQRGPGPTLCVRTGGRQRQVGASMRVIPDTNRDPMAEHIDPLSIPPEADSPPDGDSARIQAAPRARRRSRSRQAVAARRGGAWTWLDTLGRVWIGLVLLALLAGVTWIEVSL